MYKFRLLTVCVSLFVAAAGWSQARDAETVLMYVADGSRDLELMLTEEVQVMQQMLQAAGYRVDIATAADKTMSSASITLVPTVKLADIGSHDYAGVILPCMAPAPGAETTPAEIHDLLLETLAVGKPVAASRAAVVPLAKAGGVTGRDYGFASPVDTTARPEFAGGNFLGTGVHRDGNVSTAGICPLSARSMGKADGTVELTRNFIASLDDDA